MTALPLEDLLPASHLARALLRGDPAVADLLAYPLNDPEALLRAARAASQREIPRSDLARTLTEGLLRSCGEQQLPEAVVDSLTTLARPGSVVVVAGQQPGLFGGAHLVLSKALAAIGTARWIAAETGLPAVPVFWCASEDHDHGEVDHVSLPRRDDAPLRVRAALPADGRALESQPLPDSLADAWEQFTDWLPEGPGRERVLAAAQPPSNGTWADWNIRLIQRLLGPFGLVCVEPQTLRRDAVDVLRAEVRSPGAVHGQIQAVEKRLADAGLPAALNLQRPEQFFALEGGRRVRVPFKGGAYRSSNGNQWLPEELELRVQEHPEVFSWNVVTRVLAQDLALPVAAQICGPSELGYVASTAPAHRLLGIPVPALVPRPGVTVVEPYVDRALRASGMDAADIVRAGAAAWPEQPLASADGLTGLQVALDALPDAPDKGVARRLATLRKAVEQYGAAVRREASSRAGTAAGRRQRVLHALRPGGVLQERVCTPLGWIAQYGVELLGAWLELVGTPGTGHQLLRPTKLEGERDG